MCFDAVVCIDVSSCEPVAEVNSATVSHMYDIWVSSNDLLVYTDWKNKSVNVLSLSTGTQLQPLAAGLMRPSQLLFVGTERPSGSCKSCRVKTAIRRVLSVVKI